MSNVMILLGATTTTERLKESEHLSHTNARNCLDNSLADVLTQSGRPKMDSDTASCYNIQTPPIY